MTNKMRANHVFLSRKVLETADGMLEGMKGKGQDEIATALRRLMAGGDWLGEDFPLDRRQPDTKFLMLPDDVRTERGDRIVVLVCPGRHGVGEEVAVAMKALRKCLVSDRGFLPTEQVVEVPPPSRLVAFPKIANVVMKDCTVMAPRAPGALPDPVPVPAPRTVPQKSSARQLNLGGVLLREQLHQRRMKGREAGVLLGAGQSTVSCWLMGKVVPDITMASRIEDIFGIPVRSWAQPVETPPASTPARVSTARTGATRGGAMLRDRIRQRKMRLDEVGALVGISHSRLSAWQVGKSAPNADMIAKLEAVFGIPAAAWSEPL
jgi:transcriptional regulator with XRE-family HTH domain